MLRYPICVSRLRHIYPALIGDVDMRAVYLAIPRNRCQ